MNGLSIDQDILERAEFLMQKVHREVRLDAIHGIKVRDIIARALQEERTRGRQIPTMIGSIRVGDGST